MIAGPAGAVVGLRLGAFLTSFVLGTGEIESRLKQKNPDAVAPWEVATGGAAIALLDTIAPGKGGSKLVTVLGEEIAEEAARQGIGAAARELAQGASVKIATAAAKEVISEIAATKGAYKNIDWGDLDSQMTEAAVAGAFLSMFDEDGQVKGPLIEWKRATQAGQTAAMLDKTVETVRQAKLTTREPASMATFIRQISGDSSLYIPAASLPELYRSGTIDRAGLETLDITEQLPKVMEEGGDVRIRLENYLLVAAGLKPKEASRFIAVTKGDPAGMTAAEAESFLSDKPARHRDLTDLLDQTATRYGE